MPTADGDREQTLGAALQAAREAAGLTVEELSSETKIRATLIRDLEDDQFASSGGSVYARGHVKSIASSLHTDPAPLLALFDRAQGAVAPPPLEQAVEPLTPTSLGGTEFALSAAAALRGERKGPRWGVAIVGAAGVLAALIGIGQLSGGDNPARQAGLSGAEQSPTPTATLPPVQAPASHPPLSASKPPVVGAQLRVRVIGHASWVSISNASGNLFTGTLTDGMYKDFHDATRLKVIVGYGPSVSLNCGGQDSGPVAATAKLVNRFECTSAGLTSL